MSNRLITNQIILTLLMAMHLTLGCTEERRDLRTAAAELDVDGPGGPDFQLTNNSTQLAARNLICPKSEATTGLYDGTGACTGNVFVKIDLSNLSPDLSVFYNSAWPTADRGGIGRGWTLSDTRYLYIHPTNKTAAAWVQFGDGGYAYMKQHDKGDHRGLWVPDRRELLNGFVRKVDNQTYQLEMIDGTDHVFVATDWAGFYRLKSTTTQSGATQDVNFQDGLIEEFIKYSDGASIKIHRSVINGGKRISFERDRKNWATITVDADGYATAIRVRYIDSNSTERDEIHWFTYTREKPRRLTTHKLQVDGKLADTNQWLYDDNGRVTTQFENLGQTVTRFERQLTPKPTVQTFYSDGHIVTEIFDNLGRLTYSMQTTAMNPDSPIHEWNVYYNADGNVARIQYPKARTDYEYHSSEKNLLASETSYLAGVKITESSYTWDQKSWQLTGVKSSEKDGINARDIKLERENGRPYRTTRFKDGDKAEVRVQYSDKQVRAEYWKKAVDPNGGSRSQLIHLATDNYDLDGKLLSRTIAAAPEALRLTKYSYRKDGLLQSIKTGTGDQSKTTAFEYDSEQRLTKVISPDGKTRSAAFDTDGFLKEISDQWPTGLKSIAEVTQRELFGDKSLKTLAVRVSNIRPDGKQNVAPVTYRQEFRENGEKIASYINGVEVK